MFTSDSPNKFNSDFVNMFRSASANRVTSDLANMFTSDLANMCTSELEKCKKIFWPTCSLVKLTGEYVGLVPGIQYLIQKINSIKPLLRYFPKKQGLYYYRTSVRYAKRRTLISLKALNKISKLKPHQN